MTEARQTVFTGPNTFAPAKPGIDTLTHLILFKMYPGTTEAIRDEALRLMAEMCEQPGVGILRYELAESQDTRKGIILSELVTFESEEAFTAFKQTEIHRRYADFISQHADWIISDYHVPAAILGTVSSVDDLEELSRDHVYVKYGEVGTWWRVTRGKYTVGQQVPVRLLKDDDGRITSVLSV